MKFCPNCETRLRLKFDENQIACPKCGFSISEEKSTVTINVGNVTTQEHNALRVLDGENTTAESLPTISIDCPKCENNLAVWWMLQTRSADEATTQFYRCTKCNHTWRNYS
ncbi:MAG TPA: transcription factor S [Nitrososphaeraceae archaeon]|nr:transcription factor S [Nitrososphaeraceae archaeon]